MNTIQRLKQSFVALFVTFHIVCVAIYALPRPPAVDRSILDDPEVKTELESSVKALRSVLSWRDTPEEQLDDLLAFAQGYTETTDRARNLVRPYLRLVDCTQSWHMFGGTPPRFPLILAVEVRPEGEDAFVLYQDLRWGTDDSSAMNFRHRKVHENLAFWEPASSWDAYANYWAARWNRDHPHRLARVVRLSMTRLTTPTPEQIRRGDTARRPEPGQKAHEWVRP